MLSRLAAVALLTSVTAACGGTPATPPAQVPETVVGPAPGKAGHKSLAELKREFMSGCSGKVPNAPDYCECGWEQMTKTFSEEEMNSSEEDKAKLAQLKERVEGICRGKLPEAMIRGGYVQSCAGDQPKRAPYCECTWAEFRKKLSAAEMADDATVKTERFVSAKKVAVKACAAKMPEEVARDGFFQGCVKDEAHKPFCACAWKTIRAESSPAEIEGNLVDLEAARGKIDKACSKLRPAK